ncbi:MAG: indolepyruvate oxidoreductase subunit beta [Spirochaetales bacterium]|jgi:indolepyruvate ferredoxin oxidoreductase beta subunit|nr:indolepyruvate oxidoreductase subunit beta [Spirochaetales bacterium]
MKYDILLCGVGGQGVLSLAAIIAEAAVAEGLRVRQSEVHGMAQRGGAVLAHLRVSDAEIHSDLIPGGGAAMILSMEPLESLRYTDFLSPDGVLISAKEPVVNIPDYPGIEDIYAAIEKFPRHSLVPALELAKKAGGPRAVNMVLVGAASKYLPLKPESLENAVQARFASKGEATVQMNIEALRSARSLP